MVYRLFSAAASVPEMTEEKMGYIIQKWPRILDYEYRRRWMKFISRLKDPFVGTNQSPSTGYYSDKPVGCQLDWRKADEANDGDQTADELTD
jgi:hypothetical protein